MSIEEELYKLGFFRQQSKEYQGYTWMNRGQSQADYIRFINQQPYWLNSINSPEDKRVPNDIILNDYHLLFPLAKRDIQILTWLFAGKFKIFYYDNSNEFKKVDSLSALYNDIEKINILPQEEMQNQLLLHGKNVHHSLIYNHVVACRLGKIIYVTTEQLNPYQLHLNTEAIHYLDDATLATLNQLTNTSEVNEISFTYTSEYETINLVWPNSFKRAEREQLFQHIRENNLSDQGLFNPTRCKQVTSLSINSKQTLTIDLTLFSKLKALSLNTSRLPYRIDGLEKLTELESLNITMLSPEKKAVSLSLDISNLVNLTELRVGCTTYHEGKNQVKLKGIINCVNLKVLELVGPIYTSKKKEELVLPSSPHLQKLILQQTPYSQLVASDEQLRQLKKLKLKAQNIKEWPFENCSSLIKLSLHDDIDISKLHSASLRTLNLHRLSITTLSTANWPSLTKLSIKNCLNLNALNIAHSLIETLILDQSFLREIDLSGLVKLNLINFKNCALNTIKGLEECIFLETLFLSTLPHLSEIDLHNNKKLNNVLINGTDIQRIIGLPKKRYSVFHIANISEEMQELFKNEYSGYLLVNNKSSPPNTSNILAQPARQKKNLFNEANGRQPICHAIENTSDKTIGQLIGKEVAVSFNVNTHSTQTVKKIRTLFRKNYERSIPIPAQYYRQTVWDRIIIIENHVLLLRCRPSFMPHILFEKYDNTHLNLYEAAIALDEDISESFYILPGLSSEDILVYLAHAERFNIIYDQNTRSYAINLRNGEKPPKFIQYKIRTNPLYMQKNLEYRATVERNSNPLPQALVDALNHANLDIIKKIKKTFSLDERLAIIKAYCDEPFSDEQFISKKNEPILQTLTLQLLIEVIQARKGENHRSLVFFVLCQYANIGVRMINNDAGFYVEIAFRENNQTHYLAVNFNTAKQIIELENPLFANKKEMTDSCSEKLQQQANDNLMSWFERNKESKTLTYTPNERAISISPSPYLQAKKQALEFWRKQFLPELYIGPTLTPNELYQQLLNFSGKPPLLRIHGTQNGRSWHRFFHSLDKNLVFIEQPWQFTSFYQSFAIDNGKSQLVPGILAQLLQQGHGIILIDWSNFSPAERAKYKKITGGYFEGKKIANGIKIIGLFPEEMIANDVFLSRWTNVNIAKNFRLEKLSEKNNSASHFAGPVIYQQVINLYGSSEWYTLLVAELTINTQIHLKPGPLVNAVLNGEAIKICNPPINDDFLRFLHYFETTGNLFYNGEMLKPKPGFRMDIQEEAYVNPLSQLAWGEGSPEEPTFVITENNFKQCFSRQMINDEGAIITLKGWLAENYKSYLLSTKNFTSEQQQRLSDYCIQLKKQGLFYKTNNNIFMVHQVLITELKQFLINPLNSFIVSNDIGLISSQLSVLLNGEIIYLPHNYVWHELIESITLIQQHGEIRAVRKTGLFLEKIQREENKLILVGNINFEEFMPFSDLFSPNPRLYVNGDYIPIKAKIIWLANQVPAPEKLVIHDEIITGIECYETLMQSRGEVNKNLCSRLQYFIEEIESYIINFTITWFKYRQFYQAAQGDNNKNPLKPYCQLHLRDSTNNNTYAYINALAKHHFSTSRIEKVNLKKLEKFLIAKVKTKEDFKQFFWQILAHFSGITIRKILPKVPSYHIRVACEEKLLSLLINIGAFENEAILFTTTDWYKAFKEKVAKEKVTNTSTIIIKTKNLNHDNKQQQSLHNALKNPQIFHISLIGGPGTSKTYMARTIAEQYGVVFEEEKDIDAWLKLPKDKLAILIIDAMNMHDVNKWEYLQNYLNFPNKKIISTNKPQGINGLCHPFIWQFSYGIWFSRIQTRVIAEKFSHALQEACHLFDVNYHETEMGQLKYDILKGYKYLIASKECIEAPNVRDLYNLCLQAVLHKKNNPTLCWQDCTLQAVIEEFSAKLISREAQQLFLKFMLGNRINWQFTSAKSLPSTNDFVILPGKDHAWRQLEDVWSLREQCMKKKYQSPRKYGVLLEGPSGIGKTKMLRTFMDSKSTDYSFLEAGDKKFAKKLLVAAKQGYPVIIDELNLETEETLVNNLLDGFLPNKDRVHPGFVVFASQNPGTYEGTCLSQSREQRFKKIPVDDYTEENFIEIARKTGHPAPKLLRNAYLISKQSNPSIGHNARSFFAVMQKTKSHQDPNARKADSYHWQ